MQDEAIHLTGHKERWPHDPYNNELIEWHSLTYHLDNLHPASELRLAVLEILNEYPQLAHEWIMKISSERDLHQHAWREIALTAAVRAEGDMTSGKGAPE